VNRFDHGFLFNQPQLEFFMSKFIASATLAITAFMASSAFAAGDSDCHFHGNKAASQETVSSCATKRQAELVQSGKLDKAWLNVKPSNFEQIDGKKGKEWKVTFKDAAAKDKSKENLYMFFTTQGNFIAANFSGQ
jgi:hypothetical protein